MIRYPVSSMNTHNVLSRICARKQVDVNIRKAVTPLSQVVAGLDGLSPCRGFVQALRAKAAEGKPGLIAEIKKASPSKGLIRADFDPALIARIYESNGAACLSVLTEEHDFMGSDENLRLARTASSLPVLRKDFTVDLYQVYESRALGADAILLIMAALSDDQASEFHAAAKSIGLDVLVEVHDAEECERALWIQGLELLGVNNRNLKTLAVDIGTSHALAPSIPPHVLRVSESGLQTRHDLRDLMATGYGAFLIGEYFMRQPDIGTAVCSLIDL